MKKLLHTLFSCIIALTTNLHTTLAQPTTDNQQLATHSPAFTENKGQLADNKGNPVSTVSHYISLPGADVYISSNKISYKLMRLSDYQAGLSEIQPEAPLSTGEGLGVRSQPPNIDLSLLEVTFINANPHPEVISENPQPDYTNYYYSHCPQGITYVKSYEKVTLKNVWNKIDIVFYASNKDKQSLKYDFVVNPGGNPADIKLNYSQDIAALTPPASSGGAGGGLTIHTPLGDFTESLPHIYQQSLTQAESNSSPFGGGREGGNSQPITPDLSGTYTKNGDIISFNIPSYNPALPLIIDPVASWSTYYGGNQRDALTRITTDANNAVFVAGSSSSTAASFPASAQPGNSVYQPDNFETTVTSDIIVAKFSSSGLILWSTYYGGDDGDDAYTMVVDLQGNVFVAGTTTSTNFPTSVGAYQPVKQETGSGYNGCIIKFNSTGGRTWGTHFGGLGFDILRSIAIDDIGDVVITGYTTSTAPSFPVVLPYQLQNAGDEDAFIAKLNGSDGFPQWSTFYGGAGQEEAYGVGFDSDGNVLVTGQNQGNNGFPITSGSYGGGTRDIFLLKFKGRTDAIGTAGSRLWARFHGGSGEDWGRALIVASNNVSYITGYTTSTNFPVLTPLQATHAGGIRDAFVSAFDVMGALQWSTYYGTSGNEEALGIDVRNGVLAIAGSTNGDGLATVGAFQSLRKGVSDAFITMFNSNGQQLNCATYYGSSGIDGANSVTIASEGSIATCGYTQANDATVHSTYTPPGYQQSFKGGAAGAPNDGFIVKICDNCKIPVLADIVASDTSICFGDSVTLTTSGNGTITWSTGQTGNSIVVKPTVTTDYTATVTTGVCEYSKTIRITVRPIVIANAGLDTAIACTGKAVLHGRGSAGSGGPYILQWSGGPADGNWIGPAPLNWPDRGIGRYYLTVKDVLGCSHTDSVEVTPAVSTLALTLSSSKATICLGEPITLTTTATGGNGTKTYTWSADASGLSGAGPHPVTPTTTGTNTYTLKVMDDNGCEVEKSVTVNVRSLPTLNAVTTNANCNTSNGSVTLSGGVTYSFNGSPFTGTTTYSGLAAGNYMAKVNDGLCENTTTVTINNNGAPTAIATTLVNDICRKSKGEIRITGVTGGVPNYDYSVDGGAFTPTTNYTGLATGNHTVSVKDANGCFYGITVTINNTDILPVITIGGSKVICKGKSTTLTASATGGTGITYSWDTGELMASITKSPVSNTMYTVTALNQEGCSAKKSQTVTVNPTPVPIISTTKPTICKGDNAVLNSSAAVSYNWSTTESIQSITVTPGSTTTYRVTVTDGNGCIDSAKQIITVKDLPVLTVSPSDTTFCSGGKTAISLSSDIAGSSFSWTVTADPAITGASAGSGNTIAQTLSNASTAVAMVTYTITATAAGCPSSSQQAQVTVNPVPTVMLTPATSETCSGEQTAITLSTDIAGSSISWTAAADLGITGSSNGTGNTISQTLSNTSTAAATVTYTGSATLNGCTSSPASATVTVKPLPVLVTSPSNTFGGPDTTICVNTTATLKVSGASSYVWSPASSLQSPTGTPVQTATLSMGQYLFMVTGTKDGCTSSTDVEVLVLDSIPPPTVSGNQRICKGEGAILVATTSINPASFTWYANQNRSVIIINDETLITGPLFNNTTYYTDFIFGNCKSGLAPFSINIYPLPQIAITGNTPICSGDKLNLTASGGDTYRWYTAPNDTISTDSLLDAIANENTSTYYVVVKDSACIAIDTVQVQVNPLPAVNAGIPVGICKEEQAQLGTPTQTGISYQWQPVTNLSNPTLAQPTFRAKQVGRTQYTLTATDIITTCKQSANVQIDVYELPTARIDLPADVLCNDKLINLTGNGGLNAQDNYEWLKDGQVFAFLNVAAITLAEIPAAYTLRITTVQGCEDTAMLYLKGEDCDASDVYLPDMFTPNGDDANDVLQIVYKQGIISADVSIYDRWGALVYTGTKDSEPWNGKVNGQDLSEGLYVYIINLKTSKKSFNKIGTIAIGR